MPTSHFSESDSWRSVTIFWHCSQNRLLFYQVKQTTQMRKIESQMCQAVQSNRNWRNANTSVQFDAETGTSSVYLHGNLIATVTDNDMTIYDGGWQSNTTKSRLNALCDAFCIAGEGVFQKDWTWYVRKFVGAINGESKFQNVPFQSGYVFA